MPGRRVKLQMVIKKALKDLLSKKKKKRETVQQPPNTPEPEIVRADSVNSVIFLGEKAAPPTTLEPLENYDQASIQALASLIRHSISLSRGPTASGTAQADSILSIPTPIGGQEIPKDGGVASLLAPAKAWTPISQHQAQPSMARSISFAQPTQTATYIDTGSKAHSKQETQDTICALVLSNGRSLSFSSILAKKYKPGGAVPTAILDRCEDIAFEEVYNMAIDKQFIEDTLSNRAHLLEGAAIHVVHTRCHKITRKRKLKTPIWDDSEILEMAASLKNSILGGVYKDSGEHVDVLMEKISSRRSRERSPHRNYDNKSNHSQSKAYRSKVPTPKQKHQSHKNSHNSGDKGKRCNKCGKSGHTVKNCWKK